METTPLTFDWIYLAKTVSFFTYQENIRKRPGLEDMYSSARIPKYLLLAQVIEFLYS